MRRIEAAVHGGQDCESDLELIAESIAPLAEIQAEDGEVGGETEPSMALEVLTQVWPTCEALLSREMKIKQTPIGGTIDTEA